MTVTINGEKKETLNNITVAQLLNDLRIEAARVAVEVNLAIIKKAHYDDHVLNEGDDIEIVSFVGGG